MGDPKRPDPCALIKQLIPRRQVACLLAEWHYLVDAWSYGHEQDMQVLIQLTCSTTSSSIRSSIIQTLSWRRCSAAGTEMRPWISEKTDVSQRSAHATEPTCIKFVRCEHRDLKRGAARRAMQASSPGFAQARQRHVCARQSTSEDHAGLGGYSAG